MHNRYEEKIVKGGYRQIVDLKIELEKWKDDQLKSLPKFRDKEALINRTIELLVIKAAEKITDQCQSASGFEIKYWPRQRPAPRRKATERNKLLEVQVEKLRGELESAKTSSGQQIEAIRKSKYRLLFSCRIGSTWTRRSCS